MNSKLFFFVTLFLCFCVVGSKITAEPILPTINGTQLTNTRWAAQGRARDGFICSGDLNNDGEITPRDSLIAFQCYLSEEDYREEDCPECADVNQDSRVTPADALCIFQKYLGYPSCLDDIPSAGLPAPALSEITITLQKGVAGFVHGRDTFITLLWGGDDNLGGSDYLECYKEEVDMGRILISFDLESSIPQGASILEARLELYNVNWEYDETAQEISAYRITADWLEGRGLEDFIFSDQPDQSGAYWTYSGYGPWSGGSFEPTLLDRVLIPGRPDPSLIEDDEWFSWDITDAVRLWDNGSADNYGIILIGDGAGEYTGHHFRSNQYPDQAYRPRLIITYTGTGIEDHRNHPPTCEAGTYQSHEEGKRVDIEGRASDPDGDMLTFSWAQVSGPSIFIAYPSALHTYFIAPEVDEGGSNIVVRLTVSDSFGATAQDDAAIVITNISSISSPPETPSSATDAIIIDHTCTDISQVPSEWVERAKNTLRIWYGHTSHGSQITSGLYAMYSSLYRFHTGSETVPGSLSYQEVEDLDLGHHGSLEWRDRTLSQLNGTGNDRNVVMWSWCGGASDNTEAGITTYLQAMNQLELDYPEVTFIYMTGHLDGTGESGNLNRRNHQIREFCRTRGKILFDFADIESYDPDGNYYLDRGANDECYYDEWRRNWAQEWCSTHVGQCSSYECAHSHSLNCDLKARAFWWMLARIAGWDSEPPAASPPLSSSPTFPPSPSSAYLIYPDDLVYLGAFRLPDSAPGASDAEGWEYGGEALAYYPEGDLEGDEDGFPGSLFGTGHNVHNYVSEISIPVPSTSRDLHQLNTAAPIQEFRDIRGGLFDAFNELPRVGLEYLPAQSGQTSAKLYMTWGQHFHDEGEPSFAPSHAWCDMNLAHPNTAGAWWIGYESLYSTNGYLFSIPQDWAEIYTGGALLATGRFRDGGWSGKGPSLFAYGPWLEGNPPAPYTHLDAHTLLLYSHTRGDDPTDFKLNGYHDSDEWEGGAWITSGEKSAILFAGTKGSGEYCWYGYMSPAGDGMPCVHTDGWGICYNSDGTECAPELTGYCEGHITESRGWWSSRFDALILFYDPVDLAAVANGTMEPYEPQPYARLDIDEYLFLNAEVETTIIGTGDQRRYRVGAMTYDRERGLLYLFERFTDGAKPVVHVWAIHDYM